MKNLIAVALLGTALVSGAAYAQTAQPADRAAPAATTSSDKMMLKGKWRASKLMGLNVYNEANEKLGDINELILDKDGKVNAVVIGVGGFLGMRPCCRCWPQESSRRLALLIHPPRVFLA